MILKTKQENFQDSSSSRKFTEFPKIKWKSEKYIPLNRK